MGDSSLLKELLLQPVVGQTQEKSFLPQQGRGRERQSLRSHQAKAFLMMGGDSDINAEVSKWPGIFRNAP